MFLYDVYRILDSMICLIDRSLLDALMGSVSACVQVLSKRVKYGKGRRNRSKDRGSKRKLQVGFFSSLSYLLIIGKVANYFVCCF